MNTLERKVEALERINLELERDFRHALSGLRMAGTSRKSSCPRHEVS